VAQSEAARNAALASYQAAIQSAFADVDNALVAHQQIVIQLGAQERLVHALSEYERLAELQYDGGYTPYSTVLQAQQELFPQQLNLAQTRYAVYNALVNLYKAMGGGWVDIAQKQVDAPVSTSVAKPAAASQTTSTPAPNGQDRIEVSANGPASVIDVFHVGGIGGAQVKAPQSGWPSAVIVRLHGFQQLDSFQAKARGSMLDCEANRPEGGPVQHRCTLGGARVDALEHSSQYFEVKLPPALLAADGSPVELHWVDQWR